MNFGADCITADRKRVGAFKRIGMLTNDAARCASNAQLHTRQQLLHADIPLVRLFTPEHGLTADASDGAAVADGTDWLTGLPVSSLYGARFAPSAEDLADIDAVLFDVPDVGARFYTYAWTLTHLIDVCAVARIPVIVLDRPNPLGGLFGCVEGPLLTQKHYSFIGRHNIPIRHSLTLGELALLWRDERCPGADVRVVRCEGWSREMFWPDTGLAFVPTSPAIQCFEAALLYPGLVFFEATNVSVGRGTGRSFQMLQADWLDTQSVDVAGVTRMEHQLCFTIRDTRALRPVQLGLQLLQQISQQPGFEWRGYATAANAAGSNHLEKLLGTDDLCDALRRLHVPDWRERCRQILLYEEDES